MSKLPPILKLSLDGPPCVVAAGIGLHGLDAKQSRYLLPRLWCLHYYEYHGSLDIGFWRGNLEPGAVSLVPPGVALTHRWERAGCRHYFVHFEAASGSTAEVPAFLLPPPGAMRAVVEEMVYAFATQPARSAAALWWVLWEMVECSSPQRSQPGMDPVTRAKRHIEQRLSEQLSIAGIAASAGLSIGHLNLLFKEATGHTISHYVRMRRVETACGLIRHTNLAVKAAAAECGFRDLQQFNKLVRRMTGKSPREHRDGRRMAADAEVLPRSQAESAARCG